MWAEVGKPGQGIHAEPFWDTTLVCFWDKLLQLPYQQCRQKSSDKSGFFILKIKQQFFLRKCVMIKNIFKKVQHREFSTW